MWQLWNRLFGWHYVNFVGGSYSYVHRVRKDASGRMYVNFLGVVFLEDSGRTSYGLYEWTPLTWRIVQPEGDDGDKPRKHAYILSDQKEAHKAFLRFHTSNELKETKYHTKRVIRDQHGHEHRFYQADQPDKLRGVTFDSIYVSPTIPDSLHDNLIRPIAARGR